MKNNKLISINLLIDLQLEIFSVTYMPIRYVAKLVRESIWIPWISEMYMKCTHFCVNSGCRLHIEWAGHFMNIIKINTNIVVLAFNV